MFPLSSGKRQFQISIGTIIIIAGLRQKKINALPKVNVTFAFTYVGARLFSSWEDE